MLSYAKNSSTHIVFFTAAAAMEHTPSDHMFDVIIDSPTTLVNLPYVITRTSHSAEYQQNAFTV